MFVNQPLKCDPNGGSTGFGSSDQMGGPWGLLQAGIQDTTGFLVGRRDREHSEARSDRQRYQDRYWFRRDRANERRYAATALQRMTRDAKRAGIHPLAAMGAQVAGPATSFQSQNYDSGGGGGYPSVMSDPSAIRVNEAQAHLLSRQADLVEQQIKDAEIARMKTLVSNDQLHIALDDPYEVTPQTITPVIEDFKTDPSIADAQTFNNRYGEAEVGETGLLLRQLFKDIAYNITGMTNRQRGNFNKWASKENIRMDAFKRDLMRLLSQPSIGGN